MESKILAETSVKDLFSDNYKLDVQDGICNLKPLAELKNESRDDKTKNVNIACSDITKSFSKDITKSCVNVISTTTQAIEKKEFGRKSEFIEELKENSNPTIIYFQEPTEKYPKSKLLIHLTENQVLNYKDDNSLDKIIDTWKHQNSNDDESTISSSCNSFRDETSFEKHDDSLDTLESYDKICPTCSLKQKEEVIIAPCDDNIKLQDDNKRETSSQTDLTSAQISLILKPYKPEDGTFKIPSDALAEKIVNQMEFYLSDFSILKNSFLRKQIRRATDGFLNLKLLSSFRKVFALTKDVRVVAYSLEKSEKLELNKEKTKVRRKIPVPLVKQTSFGKTVVVLNIASQCTSSEELKSLFEKFGPIVHAELMTLKSPNFNAYHRRCLLNNVDTFPESFGVVEFEEFVDVLKAISDENNNLPKENKLKVVPLTTDIAKVYQTDFRPFFRHTRRTRNRMRGNNYRENRMPRDMIYPNSYPRSMNRMNNYSFAKRYGNQEPQRNARYTSTSKEIGMKLSNSNVRGMKPPAEDRQMRSTNNNRMNISARYEHRNAPNNFLRVR